MFVAGLNSTVFIIGITGNILVLCVTFKTLYGQNLSSCIFHIAVADLLFLLSLPFWAYDVMAEWIFGSFMCRTITALYMLGLYGSIFFMVLIAVYRYITVFYPQKRWIMTVKTAVFVWILSLLASLPNVIFSREIKGSPRTSCVHAFPSPAWRSFTFLNMNLLSFIIPLIILVFCYSRLLWLLSQHYDRSRKVQIRLITLLAVVIVYFLFWAPYIITLFLIVLHTQDHLNTIEWSDGLNQAMQWTEIIAFSHCSLNPIIYLLSERAFRRDVIKFFARCNLCITPSTPAPASVGDE